MTNIKTIIEHNGKEYLAVVATIRRTFLGVEDHGIFTAMLTMEWNSSGMQVGGYSLDTSERDGNDKHLGRIGTAFGLDHVMRIIETVGASDWENVAHSRVFLLFEGNDYGPAVGIANMTSGKVLIFKEHAEAWADKVA